MRLAWGILRWNYGVMASALVAMSSDGASLSPAARQAAQAQIKESLAANLGSKGAASKGLVRKPKAMRMDEIMTTIADSAAEAQLGLSPKYLQLLKSSVAMNGNLNELKTGMPKVKRSTTVRSVMGVVAKQAVGKASPHGFVVAAIKERQGA